MNQKNIPNTNKRKTSPYIFFVGLVFFILIVVGTFALLKNKVLINKTFSLQDNEKNTYIHVAAPGNLSLEPYCKDAQGKYDGYYHAGSEPLCSRAPWCGPIYTKLLNGENPGSPSDTNGYDYDSINTSEKMPNPGACADVGGPQGTYTISGLYPLCCYEIERTGDAQKCHGYWERKYCHPAQCRQIIKSESDCSPELSAAACKIIVDHNKEIGSSDYSCGVGLSARGHTEENMAAPVPLSVRLGVTGGATNTPTPTQGGGGVTTTPGSTASPTVVATSTPITSPTRTPIPTRTHTPTRTPTPTKTPTNTPTETPTKTPTSTETPTPTSSPTMTPSLTPTPPSVAMCDRTCGVCGWRDTGNVCHKDGIVPALGTACCYSTCIGNACMQVSGFGNNSCIAGNPCVVGKISVQITSPATRSASLASTKTPVVTIIYITATQKPVNQNSVIVQNQQPTLATQQNNVQQPMVTQEGAKQKPPPVSGNTGWMLLIAVPIIVIGVALIL